MAIGYHYSCLTLAVAALVSDTVSAVVSVVAIVFVNVSFRHCQCHLLQIIIEI